MTRAAVEVMSLLVDVCERIEIAGSLRRLKPEVSDVELVCVPLSEVALYRRCEELHRARIFQKRLNKRGHSIAWGQREKAVWYMRLDEASGVPKGVPVDIFIVLPDRSWGVTMLLRTGPGDANQVLVTAEGIKNNNGDLGILPRGMKFRDAALWVQEIQLETPEEWDVFNVMDMPYLPPAMRSVENYHRWAGRRKVHRPRAGGMSFVPGKHAPKWEVQPSWFSPYVREENTEQLSLV